MQKPQNLNRQFRILMVSTGGTIDKAYNETHGLLENQISLIRKNLHQFMRLPSTSIEWKSLMHMDSLSMKVEDRRKILECLVNNISEYDAIIVLHGTDTMDQTVDYIKSNFEEVSIPVIFTGAMKPFGFFDSDAIQNVTEAVICTRTLNQGLYLVFHNQVFIAGSFIKNKIKKTFEIKSEY